MAYITQILRLGVKLSVSAKGFPQNMITNVLGYTSKGVAISIPCKDGYFHPIPKNTEVKVTFFSGSGLYSFISKVRRRVLLNNTPVLLIDKPVKLVRSERREYYRIDTLFSVKLILTTVFDEGRDRQVLATEYAAMCIDISAGGMKLDNVSSHTLPLQKGMMIIVDFKNAIEGINRLNAEAVRPPIADTDGWGLKFVGISDANEANIARYVNKKSQKYQNIGG
jgi:c-di-GMP-binding flagellar brake protein YcgR